MIAPLLTVLITAAYIASLWYLLRRESVQTLWYLTLLSGLSLLLRLLYTTDFPTGFNEDEPKILQCAMLHLANWRGVFMEGCTGLPALLNTLFQAQLVPILGSIRWSIRLYSIVTSVLATPLAFAVGRSLNWRRSSSLVAAALIALLPWSIFYGRIAIGGEMVFHQMLLLAALARLVMGSGGWVEVGIGSLGQSLLLYDYFCGRTFLVFSVAAALLAQGWRRLACLAIPALAMLGWLPYLLSHPIYPYGMPGFLHPGFATQPFATLLERCIVTLKAFALPEGFDGCLTVRAGAVHPWLVLGVAALGLLLTLRRFRVFGFLLAGFAAGVGPSLLTNQAYPSTHRMLMSYPFVTLAAAHFFDVIPWPKLRRGAAVMFVAIALQQSVSFYFSDAFWFRSSRETFDADTSATVEAIPDPVTTRAIVAHAFGNFVAPRMLRDPKIEWLTSENWMPPANGGLLYAFTAHATELRPFYEAMVGPGRIATRGRAFLVQLETGDWSWLQRYGWVYAASCDGRFRQTQVPALFHPSISLEGFMCQSNTVHTWSGRWQGAPALLRLRFDGEATVSNGAAWTQAANSIVDFRVEPGDELIIRVTQPGGGPHAFLFELTPAGERVPAWRNVIPALASQEIAALP